MAIVKFGMRSHLGLVREENQDSAGVFPADAVDDRVHPGVLFVVADGMGGHRGGKEASALAVRSVSDEFFSERTDALADRLRHAVESANTAIKQFGDANTEFRGMGSTLTAFVLHNGIGVVAHVGDSRAYKISGDTITQITEDHSLVASWERKGWLTADQARAHPERSLLYRALGVRDEVEVDIITGISLDEGEWMVLCSDGLTNHVGDEEIRSAAAGGTPEAACEKLISLALERGGSDNVTVQMVTVLKG